MGATKAAPSGTRLATIALQAVGIKKLVELVQQKQQARRQPPPQRFQKSQIGLALPGVAAAAGLYYLVKSGRASSIMDQVKRRFSSSSDTVDEGLAPAGPETPPVVTTSVPPDNTPL
jgi:hypothetical protein